MNRAYDSDNLKTTAQQFIHSQTNHLPTEHFWKRCLKEIFEDVDEIDANSLDFTWICSIGRVYLHGNQTQDLIISSWRSFRCLTATQ